jgi:hypothetical protein
MPASIAAFKSKRVHRGDRGGGGPPRGCHLSEPAPAAQIRRKGHLCAPSMVLAISRSLIGIEPLLAALFIIAAAIL